MQSWTPLWLLGRLKIEFRLFFKRQPRFSLRNDDRIPKVTWLRSTALILGQKDNERSKASKQLSAYRYICDLILSSIQKVERARRGSIDGRFVRSDPKVGFRSILFRLALVACSGNRHHSMFRARYSILNPAMAISRILVMRNEIIISFYKSSFYLGVSSKSLLFAVIGKSPLAVVSSGMVSNIPVVFILCFKNKYR